VLMTGTFMAILDSSIVNIALPHIMTSLEVSLSKAQWLLTAFMLASAVAMPVSGWLGNQYGAGRLYLAALALFTIGSALCGLAWNINSLIFFRVIQAIGSGMMQPTALVLITKVFEPHERGRAIGIWGIGAMVGPTVGPTAGAYLTEYFKWRSIFTINIPVGLVLFLAGLGVFADKEETIKQPPFDWQGFSALAIFLVCLLLGLDRGQDHGWTSTLILTYFIISAVAFIFFIAIETSTSYPVIPLRLFKVPDFSIGMILAVVRATALFGAVFLLPVFLQKLRGLSTIQNGIIMIPGALSTALFMPLAGRLTDRYGARWPTLAGVICASLGLFFYRKLDIGSSYWDIIYPQFFRSAGIALMLTPVATAAMNAVAPREAGTASGLLTVGQQAGGSFGIALLSTLLSHRTVMHAELMGASPNLLYARELFSHITGTAPDPRTSQSAILMLINQAASVRAFNDVFAIGATIVIFGLLPALLLSASPPKRKPGATME